MRLLLSRFFAFIISALVFLGLVGWFAFTTNFIDNFNRALPPDSTGLRPVATLNDLVGQLPANSTFAILTSSPGVNIIVESPQATYFVVTGETSNNETFSQQLVKAGAVPATLDQVGSFKTINHEVDLYRNQHNLQAYVDPFSYDNVIMGWSLLSGLLVLFLLALIIAGLDRLRIKSSPAELKAGRVSLSGKKSKFLTTADGGFGCLLAGITLGFLFILTPMIFSQPANKLPANYFSQKDMSALIAQLPGPASITILPGPTDNNATGYHVLALTANGAVYYTQSSDPNAQAALLDEDGNVTATGSDLTTLQTANSKISFYISTTNQSENNGLVAMLRGLFFGAWFGLFFWTLLLGLLFSYYEQDSWWSSNSANTQRL